MTIYKYPCTGNVSLKGFGEYLEREIAEPRRNIKLFANELNSHLGTEYLTLVNSGSSANLVAAITLAEKCRAVGKPLTAVASAFTFPTTISSLLLAGFDVTLIDVDSFGFNMSVAHLASMNPIPSVIVATHFLGFPCDIQSIRHLASLNGSFVLLDACETFGLGKYPEEYGDITTLSFYHPHHLSSYGGGAVIVRNKEDYILCDSIAHWGRACKCHIDECLCVVPEGPDHQFTYERLGINVEMSELNASFGRWQLRDWKKIEKQRIANYRLLYSKLSGYGGIMVWEMPSTDCSPFVFPIRLVNGMDVRQAWEKLTPLGVEIRTLMGGDTKSQPAFNSLKIDGRYEKALEMACSTFFVGIHHTLSTENIQEVASIIQKTLTSRIVPLFCG